jgi:hypothetical protein
MYQWNVPQGSIGLFQKRLFASVNRRIGSAGILDDSVLGKIATASCLTGLYTIPAAMTDDIIAAGVSQWNRQNPNCRAKR